MHNIFVKYDNDRNLDLESLGHMHKLKPNYLLI